MLVATTVPAAVAGGGDDLDPSFGSDGVVLTPDPTGIAGLAVARDRRGRSIVAGVGSPESSVLLRFLPDGSLDPTFGTDGRARSPQNHDGVPAAVVEQVDGKIVLAGSTGFEFALWRYSRDGRPDRHFGRRGTVATRFLAGGSYCGLLALGMQRSGRLVAAGYGVDALNRATGQLVRYLPNGELDTSFGRGGFVSFGDGIGRAELDALVVLPSGKILVAGALGRDMLLSRRLPNGAPDPGFGGGDGMVLIHTAAWMAGLALAPGGRPLLAINSIDDDGVRLMRFQPNGTLDRAFGNNGVVRASRPNLEIGAVTVLPGGRVALSGSYRADKVRVAVLRFLPDGRPERSFGQNGFFGRGLGRESLANAAIAEPDGGLLVVGRANRRQNSFEDKYASAKDDLLLMRFRR